MGYRLLTVAVIGAAVGCTALQQRMNTTTSSFLAVASNPDDPVFLATVSAVLSDIERHSYKYDDERRKWTFQSIERLRPDDRALRSRVRVIAAMPMTSARSSERLYDYVAILNALGLLSDVRDPSAVQLNAMRLKDPLLGPSAAHNLNSLQAWNVTTDVEAGLRVFLREPHDTSGSSSYLLFLNNSAHTSRAICSDVTQALEEFESCSQSTCNSGREAAIDLNSRLRCSDRK